MKRTLSISKRPKTGLQQRGRRRVHTATRQLPVLLHRAREALAMRFREIFAGHELTDPQWRVLRILHDYSEIDVSNLAQRSYLMGPSLSRILRDLAARGLIVRHVSRRDARCYFHSLTAKAEALLRDVSPEFDPIYNDLEQQLGMAFIENLNSQLTELLAMVQRQTSPRTRAGGRKAHRDADSRPRNGLKHSY